MFPLDPSRLKGMFKQLGIKQEQIDAEEVIIKCSDKTLVVKEPVVSRIKFQGQDMLQVSGKIEEAELEEPAFTEEDVKTVMAKANVGEEEAREALVKSEGDLIRAIISFK